MKLLFWTVLIAGGIYYFMRTRIGADNDLNRHIREQTDLQNIGNVSTNANQIATGNWPLATLGQSPLAGKTIDPFSATNPFTQPADAVFLQPTPALAGEPVLPDVVM